MQYKISVIVPTLNEEQNISKAVGNVVKSFDRLDGCSWRNCGGQRWKYRSDKGDRRGIN